MLQFGFFKKILLPFRRIKFTRKLLTSIIRRWCLLTAKRYHVTHVAGRRWLVDVQSNHDRFMAIWGERDKEHMDFLFSLARETPFDRFLDVGTFVGYYTVMLKTEYPDLEIHSFEPVPQSIYQLHANLFLNDLVDKVTIHPYALSNETGKTRIQFSNSRSRSNAQIDAEEGIDIEKKILDDVLKDAGTRSLLKIDVEGFEEQAIEGMQNYLKNNDCVLQIEAWDENKDKLFAKLDSLGYECFHQITWDYYFRKKQ